MHSLIYARSVSIVDPQISDCEEQEKAIAQIATLDDISLMIETNDDPITDAENRNDLKEMFRSTMAIRYGISGPKKQWDFQSTQGYMQQLKAASSWVQDEPNSGYGEVCNAWKPLAKRNSIQDNQDTCFDECVDFQRWIKEEIESNNIYNSLSQYAGSNSVLLDTGIRKITLIFSQ